MVSIRRRSRRDIGPAKTVASGSTRPRSTSLSRHSRAVRQLHALLMPSRELRGGLPAHGTRRSNDVGFLRIRHPHPGQGACRTRHTMTRAEFERLVVEAIRLIPQRFRREMQNLALVVEKDGGGAREPLVNASEREDSCLLSPRFVSIESDTPASRCVLRRQAVSQRSPAHHFAGREGRKLAAGRDTHPVVHWANRLVAWTKVGGASCEGRKLATGSDTRTGARAADSRREGTVIRPNKHRVNRERGSGKVGVGEKHAVRSCG